MLKDPDGFIDQGPARRSVGHGFQFLEQPVERRVCVVGDVVAPVLHFAVGAVEQEKEVLGIGVVGEPDVADELPRTLAELIAVAAEFGAAFLETDSDQAQPALHPFEVRAEGGIAAAGMVEVQRERRSVRTVAVRVSRPFHELARGLEGTTLRTIALRVPFVHERVGAFGSGAIAEDAGRQRSRRRHAPAVSENVEILVWVQHDRDRLAQSALFRGQTSDDFIEHVELGVIERHARGGRHGDPPGFHGVRKGGIHARLELDGLVEDVGGDVRVVVVALEELAPGRDGFLFQDPHLRIDERKRLAGVAQASRLPVVGVAGVGIAVGVIVGVAFEDDVLLRQAGVHVVGSAADRVASEGELFFPDRGLLVEVDRLARHWRKEVHGHPVEDLRILALEHEFERTIVDRFKPLARIGLVLQLDGGRALAQFLAIVTSGRAFPSRAFRRQLRLQLFVQPIQAEHVALDRAVDRTLVARIGQPADLEEVVFGQYLARALVREAGGRIEAPYVGRRNVGVDRPSLRVAREAGVVLVQNARLDAYRILDSADRFGGRVRGVEPASLLVEIGRLGDLFGCQRDQFIGAVQVVIGKGRFADLVHEAIFTGVVRVSRIEFVGSNGIRREIGPCGSLAFPVRVVGAPGKHRNACDYKVTCS